MASNIDESVPADASAVDKALVRANFSFAKQEIEALQLQQDTAINNVFRVMRNHIINGDMTVQQNYGTAVGIVPPAVAYPVDKWILNVGLDTAMVTTPSMTAERLSNSGLSEFPNYLRVTCVTGRAAGTYPASTGVHLYQVLEGLNTVAWQFGTVNAKNLVLTFYARASTAGKYSGSLRSGKATGRFYVFEFTLAGVNAWEKQTIVIPGDTTGSWAVDNTAGAYLYFALGASVNTTGAANTWTATLRYGSSGSVYMANTAGATFDVTGVQLEIGTVATTYEHRLSSLSLSMCQRYYYVLDSGLRFGSYAGAAAEWAYVYIPFPSQFPAIPQLASSGSSPLNAVTVATSGDSTGINGVTLRTASVAAGPFNIKVDRVTARWQYET